MGFSYSGRYYISELKRKLAGIPWITLGQCGKETEVLSLEEMTGK
ncbi:MAG: hypothetical protein NTV68_10915 [Methanomicrobiales archaeon]|nr:hypothetical protein [Methanomicrobiales archaeon]